MVSCWLRWFHSRFRSGEPPEPRRIGSIFFRKFSITSARLPRRALSTLTAESTNPVIRLRNLEHRLRRNLGVPSQGNSGVNQRSGSSCVTALVTMSASVGFVTTSLFGSLAVTSQLFAGHVERWLEPVIRLVDGRLSPAADHAVPCQSQTGSPSRSSRNGSPKRSIVVPFNCSGSIPLRI